MVEGLNDLPGRIAPVACHLSAQEAASRVNQPDRLAFGSRILFEPELAVGYAIASRTSIEASWVHMSHATLFSRQNPGIDNFGVRLNLKL